MLVLESTLALLHVGLRLLEPRLGRGERGAHLLVALLRDPETGPYVAQLGARLGELLAGVREGVGRPAQPGARLVEVVVGPLDLAVHLLLLVAQLAGVRGRC